MIRWTGLAPWEVEFPFPGSLTSTFLSGEGKLKVSPIAGTFMKMNPAPYTLLAVGTEPPMSRRYCPL